MMENPGFNECFRSLEFKPVSLRETPTGTEACIESPSARSKVSPEAIEFASRCVGHTIQIVAQCVGATMAEMEMNHAQAASFECLQENLVVNLSLATCLNTEDTRVFSTHFRKMVAQMSGRHTKP